MKKSESGTIGVPTGQPRGEGSPVVEARSDVESRFVIEHPHLGPLRGGSAFSGLHLDELGHGRGQNARPARPAVHPGGSRRTPARRWRWVPRHGRGPRPRVRRFHRSSGLSRQGGGDESGGHRRDQQQETEVSRSFGVTWGRVSRCEGSPPGDGTDGGQRTMIPSPGPGPAMESLLSPAPYGPVIRTGTRPVEGASWGDP
jgi:hypothetical protein